MWKKLDSLTFRAFIVPALTVLALTGLPAPQATAVDPRNATISLRPFAVGLSSPVAIAAPYDGTNRLFVAQQGGVLRMVDPAGRHHPTPLLDLRDRVSTGGERGLLGVAVHPYFDRNGWLFVAYTDLQGDLRVSRFIAERRSNRVNRNTELVILDIAHRAAANHNGGQIAFGSDHLLYVATGDGGGGGDPSGNAQNTVSLLGKILRVDVSRSSASRRFGVPAGNPFGTLVWHYGLRNPWRFSFDPSDQRMWIADVGQGDREEIDVAARNQPGRNFGWDCREGSVDTTATYGGTYCAGKSFHAPLFEYSQVGNSRCAIIGGHVYRGTRFRNQLFAVYVYADFCSGEVWGLGRDSSGGLVNSLMHTHSGNLSSFGVDTRYELYATDLNGTVYKVEAATR